MQLNGDKEDNTLLKIKNNNDINTSLNLIKQRNDRQEYNNIIAYNDIKKNSKVQI